MKYLIILILFASVSFGQVKSVLITKTDTDSLWYDFNFMYSEMTLDKYRVTINTGDYLLFNKYDIACSWTDLEPKVLKKVLKRVKKK